ncbi:MAG TPA: hypothetical protein VGJ18_21535 [Gemmatimonadaceae bacterium]|jgi:hypothetical protein
MRHLIAFATLCCAACASSVTATEANTQASSYALESVDEDALPAQPEYSSRSRWVLSGSLTLDPSGYFVLSESDSIWNGRAFAREDRMEGGQWTADGSLLTLSDTSAESNDPYGAATTYIGGIAADGVLLTIATADGTETHTYLYRRQGR